MAYLPLGLYRKTDGAVLDCDWLVGLKIDVREIDGAVLVLHLPPHLIRLILS